MTGAMLVVNDSDGACPRNYTLKNRLDKVTGGVLSRISDKNLDALKYISLYQFAPCMGADPVRTAMVISRCLEVELIKNALQGGFVSYNLNKGKVHGLEEQAVTTGKRARGANLASMSGNLPAILVLYRAWQSRIALESVERNQFDYCGVSSSPNEASGAGTDVLSVMK